MIETTCNEGRYIDCFLLDIEEPESGQFSSADMNTDGALNIQDVILIINVILG